MAETGNTARLAELMADKVFGVFRWRRTGGLNLNWPCEKPEEHKKRSHPSDMVFYYDEPYSLQRTYINCDVKSYKKESISTGAIVSAMESLGLALACAEISESWRTTYVDDNVNSIIVGLLFVFNHDGEYDKDFDNILADLRHEKLKIPKGTRIFVLGPRQVQWLDNISYEIIHMRGSRELPGEDLCSFHYPELVLKKNVQRDQAGAAILEMLTGPWVTLKYGKRGTASFGFVVFYRRRGESVEEFLYILDYLMHYQMIDSDIQIKLRILDPDINAPSFFKRAFTDYVDSYDGGESMAGLLNRIEYRSITNVVNRFSEFEVGMNHG